MNKLPYFPRPLPDELFYSICARYHDDSPNASCQQTMKDLYGVHNVTAMVEFPSRVNSIIERLSPRTTITAKDLILNNTLLPLYLPFISAERGRMAINQMMVPDLRLNVSLLVGQNASNMPLIQHLRFCPRCIDDDMLEHGEPYWHRIHQLACMLRCYKHEEWLQKSNAKVGTNSPRHVMTSLSKYLGQSSQILRGNDNDLEHHRWLAKTVHRLLNNPVSSQFADPSFLQQQYRKRLSELGYLSSGGHIAIKQLLNDFNSYYREDFLQELSCSLVTGKHHANHNWLLTLLRLTGAKSHPLHHLLAIRFLNISIERTLCTNSEINNPFGSGPWPCLNRMSEHFGALTIATCDITKDTRTPTVKGVFSCACGFVYERIGPENSPEERVKFKRIIRTGPVWDQKLLEMTSKKFSLLRIARELGVSRYETNKHLGRLAAENTPAPGLDVFLTKRDQSRAVWLSICRLHPGKDRVELARADKNLFLWLSSFDREWLDTNFPIREKSKNQEGRPKDWAAEDSKLALLVPAAVEAVSERGSQLTMTSISKELGIVASIYAHRDKLPQTMSVIDHHVESDEAFALRRIGKVVAEMRKHGETITRGQVLQRACVSAQMVFRINEDVKKIVFDNSDPMFDFANMS